MTQVREALAVPRRSVVGFFRGLSFPFRGAKLVYFENPDLIRYWAVPIVVTSAVLIASLWAVFHYDDAIVSMVWSEPARTGDDWEGWALAVAHGAFELVIDVLLLVLAFLVTLIVSSVVAAPFNARLAEVLDERVTRTQPPAFELARVAMDLVRAAAIELGFAVVNAILFVAGIALPVASPGLFVIGMIAWALYFGIAYVDAPLASRGLTLGERLRFVRQQPMAMLGFGTGVGVFLLVPIVNLLFMPAAVAGGVLFCAAASEGAPQR